MFSQAPTAAVSQQISHEGEGARDQRVGAIESRKCCGGSLRPRRLDKKGDALVKALGVDGVSRPAVSRMGGKFDTVITGFRTGALTAEHRHLWVNALYYKVRVDGRVISRATVAAGTSRAGGIATSWASGRPRIVSSGRPFCAAPSITACDAACG